MTPNAFIGRTQQPSEADLTTALGDAKPAWDLVVVEMAEELGLDDREWKSYGVKHGWALRLKRGKRNIVYLSPCHGCFRSSSSSATGRSRRPARAGSAVRPRS